MDGLLVGNLQSFRRDGSETLRVDRLQVGYLQSFRRDGIETLRGRRAVGWEPTEF